MQGKVGLITFFDENYGSALQCFATKTKIEEFGFDCSLFKEIVSRKKRYLSYPKKLIILLKKSVLHPKTLKNFLKYSKKSSGSTISKKSYDKIAFFGSSVLKYKPTNISFLKKISSNENYFAFVVGSDQVWNCFTGLINPFYFLDYIDGKKRIAFAPSFGTEKLNQSCKAEVKKILKKFNYLSCREESGSKIVESLTGRKCQVVGDPTLLLTKNEWRKFAFDGIVIKEKYMFVHFLDRPSKLALNTICRIQKEKKLKIVTIGYNYEEYKIFDDFMFLDGSPYDYISLIERSEFVCTDSFHTTSFSTYFSKSFYVFERQYKHCVSQSSRLDFFLNNISLYDRYIKNEIDNVSIIETEKYQAVESKLAEIRIKTFNFLYESLVNCSNINQKTDNNSSIYENFCTGCGLCISVCPKKAITFVSNKFGFEIPKIDNEKCIHCNKCFSICPAKKKNDYRGNKKAFIAYNTQTKMRDKSASGGIFSALATKILNEGGVVFGAKYSMKENFLSVEHTMVDCLEKLPEILGSKYVQSDCSMIYPIVKQQLLLDKKVIFCGTSCQIEALCTYLERVNCKNLLTVDLICHGVPGRKLFKDHIQFIENKFHGKVVKHEFRKKDGKNILYIETFWIKKKNKTIIKSYYFDKMPYYSLFLNADSYRESCYNCKLASINKPADITIGDYFEATLDYPFLFAKGAKFYNICGISSIIAHNEKALKELDECKMIEKEEVEIERVQFSHTQLCKPSMFSKERFQFQEKYPTKGYKTISFRLRIKNMFFLLPSKIISRIFNKE